MWFWRNWSERFKLTDGAKISRLLNSNTWAGKPVNEDNSMQLSAWWRCVKLHAEITGGLPLKFYERLADGSRKQVFDHEVAIVIAESPNDEQTPQEFWSNYAAALAIQGNAMAEKRYVGKALASLEPLPTDTVPYRTKDWALRYKFSDRGKPEELPADKVFHTKLFNLGKSDWGLSPLAAARQTLSIALATEQATGATFAQGLRLSGFFSGPGLLKQEQRDEFTKAFIEPILGNDANAHYGILEAGYEFKPINIPPKDAEMLLSRRFNVEEIARFMGTPPIMIGHAAEGQTMWGTGVEAIINMWLTLGYDMFLRNIEFSIKKRLMAPEDRRTFYPEYDRNALLRADSQGRSELYSKMANLAALTPNQICDKENLPRFAGGDVRLVNSTLVRLDALGQQPKAQLPPPA